MLVAIPTNRHLSPHLLRAVPEDVPILVVNDGDSPIEPFRPGMQVFDREDIRGSSGPMLT